MAKAKTFGYARVISKEQNEPHQLDAILQEGIDERDILSTSKAGKALTVHSIKP